MTRRLVFDTARVLASSVLGVLLLAGSTYADPITMNFTSVVDFTSIGGGAADEITGSITWDPATAPFEVEAEFSTYDPLSYTLFFNGANVGGPVIGDGTGSGISIVDDGDPLGFGENVDAMAFFLAFEVPFVLPNGQTDLVMLAVLAGPTDMFNSRDLPANLNFLNQVTIAGTLWHPDDEEDQAFFDAQGSLEASAPDVVPEPATLSLIALGFAGAYARARRARRTRTVLLQD
jgi:hypothetical protein